MLPVVKQQIFCIVGKFCDLLPKGEAQIVSPVWPLVNSSHFVHIGALQISRALCLAKQMCKWGDPGDLTSENKAFDIHYSPADSKRGVDQLAFHTCN